MLLLMLLDTALGYNDTWTLNSPRGCGVSGYVTKAQSKEYFTYYGRIGHSWG